VTDSLQKISVFDIMFSHSFRTSQKRQFASFRPRLRIETQYSYLTRVLFSFKTRYGFTVEGLL